MSTLYKNLKKILFNPDIKNFQIQIALANFPNALNQEKWISDYQKSAQNVSEQWIQKIKL